MVGVVATVVEVGVVEPTVAVEIGVEPAVVGVVAVEVAVVVLVLVELLG